MDLVRFVRAAVVKMIDQCGFGMKALLMDKETVGIVSVAFMQSEVVNKGVLLFETTSSPGQDKVPHMSCVCFIRPTDDNVRFLCQELSNPRYGSYHIYFSNLIDRNLLRQLAEADEKELVQEMQEYFVDYYPLCDNLFTAGVVNCSQGNFEWHESALKRCVSAVLSILLSMKKCPIIRYQASSAMCKTLSEALSAAISKEASMFNFNMAEASTLLVIDRREDPITPVLNQWTYEAMLHELLGLRRNRVMGPLYGSDGSEYKHEVVVSSEHDEFYAQNRYSNFGEIAINIKSLMESYQESHKSQSKIENIADMKAFVENYPKFKKLSGTTTKHVTLVSELSRQVSTFRLMETSEIEQMLVSQEGGDHAEIIKRLKTCLADENIRDIDALRLVTLYALRFEQSHSNELKGLKQLLSNRKMCSKWLKFLDSIIAYGGTGFRQADLFSRHYSFTKQIIQGFMGIDNIYCQHKPLLLDTIDVMVRGKLRETQFPYAGINNPVKDQRTSNIIIFCVGGLTFEEVCFVNTLASNKPGVDVLLGCSDVHNFSSFIEEVIACSSKSTELCCA